MILNESEKELLRKLIEDEKHKLSKRVDAFWQMSQRDGDDSISEHSYEKKKRESNNTISTCNDILSKLDL
ncbi:hypothetical protein JOC34_000529 [Virgibacillus halotolerans]|uniref:hypothetical protein n=1 Tax=Virgibacillus halotolerans TaxID=1071053 RepID=UPI001961533A|nr:hypothetical protein [Virgibacillus halotolerans]MBM7598172.1 hypothetical protein [Virgibacillus halotolerans]